MTTKKVIRDQVLNSLSDTRPLRFDPKLGPLKKRNLDEFILFLLKISRDRYSVYVSNGVMQTNPGRRRSSQDIWRHVIFHRKNVTIFNVMASLYRLAETNVLVHGNCSVLKRMVFFYPENEDGTFFNKHILIDEYGLEFSQWENIDK